MHAEHQWSGKGGLNLPASALQAPRLAGLIPVRPSRRIEERPMEQTAPTIPPKAKRRYAREGAGNSAPPTKMAPARPKAASKQAAGKPPASVPRVTKANIVIGLLTRPAGATIAQMCEATGWQQHSVRGFLAATVKKKPGMALGSNKTDAVRTYRLTTNDTVSA